MNLYVEVAAVLLLTWLVMPFLRRVPVSQTLLLRVAQLIAVCALAFPVAILAVPERKLPVVKFEIFAGPEHPKFRALPVTRGSSVVQKAEPVVAKSPSFMIDWSKLALMALLIGWIAMLARLAWKYRSLARLVNRSIKVREIGRVRVAVSDEISVPFSTLLGRKAHVVVPISMASNSIDFKLAIHHELQHHRSRDTAWANAIEFAIVVYFWNPAVYLWKKEIIQIQELACDETLIGQRRVSLHQYGSCLLKVAEAALVHHSAQIGTVCMAVMSNNPNRHASFLRRRIEMFASHKSPKRRKHLGLALGTLGLLFTAVASYGAQQSLRPTNAPNPGSIAFDPAIQKITQDTLAKYITKFKAKAGFVIVTEPSTGRVLAVANISDDATLPAHWALSTEIEPASALKVPTMATALQTGATSPDEMHDCANGTLTVGNGTYHDHAPFSTLTTADTIVKSSNLCSIRIAQKLGAKEVYRGLVDFGFGAGGTTSGFPQARAGEIPNVAQYSNEDYEALIGMGVSGSIPLHVTPLEMVQAYAAIANRGQLMRAQQASSSKVEVIRQVLSPATANEVKAILRRAVVEGTGQAARSPLYSTAGKTSTAFDPAAPEHDSNGGERSMAGFVGFAPLANPRVAVYVGVFEPHEGKHVTGGRHAAPVFREVVETVLQHMGVAPDLH